MEFPAQTACGDPAFTVTNGFIVMATVDETVVHGPLPSGSAVVRVKVTAPDAISDDPGV
jgi:hypothetical protein